MSVLMMIGPVKFEVAPFNIHAVGHDHESTFAEKPILGSSPLVEWVGEGAETWSLQGRLFPQRFGGLDSLRLLQEARASGQPQYMMRGDGTLMGWVVIERVSERSSFIDLGGIGKAIDFDISVRRAMPPAAGLYFSIMEAIFR